MTSRLRIATFNLESLDDRPCCDGDFTDRLAVLRPQLARLRADILCLQEVNARATSRHGPRCLSALNQLLENSPYADFHRVVSANRAEKRFSDHHNLVTLSRWPIGRHRQVWHNLVPPPTPSLATGEKGITVEWDRPLLYARIDLDQCHLHIVNLHLRAPRAAFVGGQKEHGIWKSVGGWAQGFFLAAIKQAGQALEARLLVDQIFDEDPHGLIAVCGDFNARDSEVPVRTIRGDEEDTGNGHLAMRTLVPIERSLPENLRFSAIHHGRPVMLDHILVSRPLLAWYLGAEVHNETLGDELVSPALVRRAPDSYHAPIIAAFEPSGAPCGPPQSPPPQASG